MHVQLPVSAYFATFMNLTIKSFITCLKQFTAEPYGGVNVGISASLANASAATFQLLTLKQVETCIDMMTDAKHFILCSQKRNICSQC